MFNVFECHPEKQLTLDQAAGVLGVPVAQLPALYRKGLRACWSGSRKYIKAADIVSFIAETGHQAAEKQGVTKEPAIQGGLF